jgi:hypothetical protein
MSKGIESRKADGRGAQLGVKVNHKEVKLHGVRNNTQDQPSVEDGKQKHHTGLPGVRKGREKCKRSDNMKKKKKQGKPEDRESPRGISKGEVLQKSPNTPPAHWRVQP